MKRIIPLTISSLIVASFIFVNSANAAVYRTLPIEIYNLNGELESSFEISIHNNSGGASLAVADLGVDGVSEIILGQGFGNDPRVRIFRQDGSEITSFLAYAENFGRGINVAACDIDQDGYAEIVTGTQYGGGPQVRVFDTNGETKFNNGFFAYAEDFRGGVNVACDDLDGDGEVEIVTAPGPTGGPHVRMWEWNGSAWQTEEEFFAFDANDSGGANIEITNSSNGHKQLLVSHMTGTNSEIISYSIHSAPIFISSVQKNVQSGINFSKTVDNNLVIAPTEFGNNNVRIEKSDGGVIEMSKSVPQDIMITELDQDGQSEIVMVPNGMLVGPKSEKHILIDVSEQRLFAYQNGLLTNSFYISSGLYSSPTPQGNFDVLAKKEWVDYTWSYGEGNPNNYSLGLTPWNLMFQPHFYIHSAPWHSNYGNRMSHGCVNASTENAEWIFQWADVGIPVDVVD